MKRLQYYIGKVKGAPDYELITTRRRPTEKNQPKYSYLVGKFRTKRGAMFMLKYGRNNPTCQTVKQAERLAILHGEKITAEFKRQRATLKATP